MKKAAEINSRDVVKKRLDAAVSHHVIERAPQRGRRDNGMNGLNGTKAAFLSPFLRLIRLALEAACIKSIDPHRTRTLTIKQMNQTTSALTLSKAPELKRIS
jgi:hypothetical protein